jgi:hypothetical protein
MEIIPHEQVMKALEHLKRGGNKPPELVELNNEIDGRVRALELRVSVSGKMPTQDEIREIVGLKLKKDQVAGEFLRSL